MVAGEQEPILAQGEADMVRRMAWRVDAFEGPPVPFDDVSAAHLDLGDELHVASLLHLHRAAGSVRAVAVDRPRPDLRLERPGRRRVVVVGMGDEDVAHLLAGHRGGEGLHVLRQVRPRIDHRDPAAPHDVGTGPVQGECARIARDHPPHGHRTGGGDEVRPAVFELELAPERYLDGHFPLLLSVMARRPCTSRSAPAAIVSRSTAA